VRVQGDVIKFVVERLNKIFYQTVIQMLKRYRMEYSMNAQKFVKNTSVSKRV